MTSKKFACIAVCAAAGVLGVLAVGQASASEFYGVNPDGVLTRFDMSAHTVTTIGSIHAGPTSPTGFEDIDYDGSGNLYAIRAFVGSGFPPVVANELYRITNPATAGAILSTSLGTGTPVISLAYQSSNSSFYGVNGVNGYLGTIDVNTGAFGPVSSVPNGIRNTVYALAVNPTTGLAYGIIDAGSPPPFGSLNLSLISMNLSTGLSTVIGSLGVGQDRFTSLRFDDAGTAYTVDINNGGVYTLNLGTGAASFLFAGGSAAVNTSGLAFISVPAPGAACLLAAAVLPVYRRRRAGSC